MSANLEIIPPLLPLGDLQSLAVPTLIVAAGEPAAMRFMEFFTANIRNPSIRKAYA